MRFKNLWLVFDKTFLNGKMSYVKIVDFTEMIKFGIQIFFIWGHLVSHLSKFDQVKFGQMKKQHFDPSIMDSKWLRIEKFWIPSLLILVELKKQQSLYRPFFHLKKLYNKKYYIFFIFIGLTKISCQFWSKTEKKLKHWRYNNVIINFLSNNISFINFKLQIYFCINKILSISNIYILYS